MKSRKHVQCNTCKHHTGFTAGTIFHSTKLPLTTWFRAIYALTQAKGGISSIELARRLGVRQPTALRRLPDGACFAVGFSAC